VSQAAFIPATAAPHFGFGHRRGVVASARAVFEPSVTALNHHVLALDGDCHAAVTRHIDSQGPDAVVA
jgi:hypothetical protein